MHILPGVGKGVVGRRKPLVAAFIGATSTSSTLASTKTWAAQAIGAAAADREVFALISAYKRDGGGHVINSLTIGGIAATIHMHAISSSTFSANAILASAKVPTGTTADVVLNMTQTFVGRLAIVTATGLASRVARSADKFESGGVTGSFGEAIVDAPQGGVILGVSQFGGDEAASWTGVSEIDDVIVNLSGGYTIRASSGMLAPSSLEVGRPVRCTWAGSSGRIAVAAASFR